MVISAVSCPGLILVLLVGVIHWHRLAKEAVAASSLTVLKAKLDRAWSNLQ